MAQGAMQAVICDKLHNILNSRQRYKFPFDPGLIPENGIYVLFEEGEKAHGGCDRVVRIGTHTGQNNLAKRLAEHFLNENKDRSIFRKNIGRALLHQKNDSFFTQWEIDLTPHNAMQRHAGQIDFEKLSQLEKEVSEVIRDKFTFCVFRVDSKEQRLYLEERMIATVNMCTHCKPSDAWFGNYSPKRQIRESGMWLVQGLNGHQMCAEDLDLVYWQCET